MTIYTLTCKRCSKKAFLFFGLCSDCAPELHAANQQCMDFMGEAENVFKAQTGKTSLEAWYEFEEFLSGYLAQHGEAVKAFGLIEEYRGVEAE